MGKRFRRLSLALAGFVMALGVGVAIGSAKAAGTPMETRATGVVGYWEAALTGAPSPATGDTTINGMPWNVSAPASGASSSRWQLATNSAFSTSTVLSTTGYADPVLSISLGWYTNSKMTVTWTAIVGDSNPIERTVGNGSGTGSGTIEFDFSSVKPSGTITLSASNANGGYGLTSISISSAATVTAVSSMKAMVTAKPGDSQWSVSNVFVVGTLNGIPNSNVSKYVQLETSTSVPTEETDPCTVTFAVTRKTGIGGEGDLGTLSVTDAVVSSDEFVNYSLVKSIGAVDSQTLYALGTQTKNQFASDTFSSSALRKLPLTRMLVFSGWNRQILLAVDIILITSPGRFSPTKIMDILTMLAMIQTYRNPLRHPQCGN